MTDRIHSLTLVLEENIRIDDMTDLLAACRALKHVVSVGTNVADSESYMAQERARNAMFSLLLDTVNNAP